MPLSKAKNRERMRKSRLHKRLNDLIVQPNKENVKIARQMLPMQMGTYAVANKPEIDADGNPIYGGE